MAHRGCSSGIHSVDEKYALTFYFGPGGPGTPAARLALNQSSNGETSDAWFEFIAHRYAYTDYDITVGFIVGDDSNTVAELAVPEGANYTVGLSGLPEYPTQLRILKIIEECQAQYMKIFTAEF
jgi:hypothetical protein